MAQGAQNIREHGWTATTGQSGQILLDQILQRPQQDFILFCRAAGTVFTGLAEQGVAVTQRPDQP